MKSPFTFFQKLLLSGIFAVLVFLPLFLIFADSDLARADSTTTKKKIQLTEVEQQWLMANHSVRIGFDGNFPPYSFLNDNGKVVGIAFDVIQLISDKTGLKFSIAEQTEWTDLYQAALDKKVDIVATMVDRPERQAFFDFTTPIVYKSLIILTHADNRSINQRTDLNGITVALVEGYQYSKRIMTEFPGVTPYYVNDMREALTLVSEMKADAAISFHAAADFLQKKYLIGNLRIAAVYDRNSSNESIAIRKDWPILTGILQKAVDSITEQELQAIRSRWHIELKPMVDYNAILRVVLYFSIIVVMLFSALLYYRRQKNHLLVVQKKLSKTNDALTTLKNSLEQTVQNRTLQLKTSEKKYRNLVENLKSEYFFFSHDKSGILNYLSPSVEFILGYTPEEALTDFRIFLTDALENTLIEDHLHKCYQGQEVPPLEISVYDKQGKRRWLQIVESASYDEQGQVIGVEGIAHDITTLKQTSERLHWLSYYDDLTSLPNRRLFMDRFQQILTQANRRSTEVTLLFLDVDRFKMVNDTLGHAAGDQVLQESARRLQQDLRESDIAARMGGDEFTIILPDTGKTSAQIVIDKISRSLSTPFEIGGQQFNLGTSIGVSIFPADGHDCEVLLQLADSAMYQAKKMRSGHAFCSQEMQRVNNRRYQLEQNLREALQQHSVDPDSGLSLVFQSKHSVQSRRLMGYEALTRWHHPQSGTISPVEFIPLAEETGLIGQLSSWVIHQAALQAKAWHEQGIHFGKISINISAQELINTNLAHSILSHIDKSGAQRDWFIIEITESALMKSPDMAIEISQQLIQAGLKVAIDDFGTGYSSLAYLTRLPAQIIKIDQSFIRNVLLSPEHQAVVQAILAMSRALGKQVIAEGVETQEQFELLRDWGCDMVQGYWFSRPLPAIQIAAAQKTEPA